MKKFSFLLIAVLCLSLVCASAWAERRVDESGAYTYDYDKSIYDMPMFGNYTYGSFLQRHGNTSFDYGRFVNSEFGELYAQRGMLNVLYPGNMDEGLLAHWKELGMNKILVHPEGAEDSAQDYYIYTPVDMDPQGKYPLVFVNHGGGASARVSEAFGWVELAGREKLILIMAENTEVERLHEILEEVKANYPVDAARVYLTGSSEGGRRSKMFAGKYPAEVAAIAPMNVTFAFLDGDGDPEQLAALKMPMIITAGTADMYYILPVHDEGNDADHSHGSIEGWNTLVKMFGFEQYAITPEESAALLESSTDLLEHYTGLRLPKPVIYNYINNRTFQCNFTGDDGIALLSLVIEENGPHDPIGYDAQHAWNFMKRFSRNNETGELIVNQD